MNLSISHLEQLSGVPVHTIRIWERRYNALTPMRSAGNTRFYTDEHLKRLLDIVGLSQSGMKISKACALSAKEIDVFLEQAMHQTISSDNSFEYYVAQLLKHGLGYDETNFNELLNACITEYGIDVAYQGVMFPLLKRIGLLWRRDQICPAQEHFLSNIVRQKLMVAIDQIPLSSQKGPSWLLYLPEDEAHDIPLLFASFMLRSQGFRVVYLGERVPLDSIKEVCSNVDIANILLFMVRQRPVNQANNYISALSENFPLTAIYLAGNGKLIENLDVNNKVIYFKTIEEFKQLIKPIGNAE